MTTKIKYVFSNGFDSPILSIPFRYAMKEHICVFVDAEQLTPGMYIFETAGTIRLDIHRENAATVTLQRMTVLRENSPLTHVVMALEELRDAESEMRAETEVIKHSTETAAAIAADTLAIKIAETKVSAIFEANQALGNVKLIVANLENIVNDALALENEKRITLKKNIDEKTETSEKRMEELWRLLDERTVFLSRAISAAFDTCRAETDNIRADIAEISARPAAMQAQLAMPVTANILPPTYDSSLITVLKETLAQTSSALNIETLMRRSEDAQLKVLIKKLLWQHKQIEDYLAGKDANFPESVLSDLRAELRLQDDKLGRIALANIARIDALNEKL